MAVLGAGSPCWGAEPTPEADLVRRYLGAPVATTDLEAIVAQSRADGTAVSLLDSPTLAARHDAARGDWGATTTAVGASVTLDLGLSPLAHTRAGRLRGTAGQYRGEAAVLAAVCDVRADAVDLWAANRAASVSEAAQSRLDTLYETLSALAEAGEASGYDRDRTALAVAVHQTGTADRLGALEALRARLSVLVGGEPVVDVSLSELTEAPPLDASLDKLSGHPTLQASTLERAAAEADREGARLDQIPDLTVSGGPRWDAAPTGGQATPGFEVGGTLQLPWMSGERGAARQRTAEHAAAEARLTRASAELEAELRGAHRRVETLMSAPSTAADPERVWTAAEDRYAGGETSLEELLLVAETVEAARLAELERERLTRRALLDLSCATGEFADPAIQSALEEAAR